MEGEYFIEWASVLEGALKITWSRFFIITEGETEAQRRQ